MIFISLYHYPAATFLNLLKKFPIRATREASSASNKQMLKKTGINVIFFCLRSLINKPDGFFSELFENEHFCSFSNSSG